MRTVFTTTLAAILFLTAFAGSNLTAEEPAAKKQPAAEASEKLDKEIEKSLDTKFLKVDFVETPLKDILGYFSESLDIDILLDRRVEDLGVTGESPVTFSLNKRPIRARTALELALRQLHPELDFGTHDGVLLITGANDSYRTEVYNVAGLLPEAKPEVASPPAGAAAGSAEGANPFGQMSPADQLRQVVTSTVDPNSWSETGGSGSANVLGTLLVVKNSPKAHREIRDLLAMMEKALRDGKMAPKK